MEVSRLIRFLTVKMALMALARPFDYANRNRVSTYVQDLRYYDAVMAANSALEILRRILGQKLLHGIPPISFDHSQSRSGIA